MSISMANQRISSSVRLCITCAYYGGARSIGGFGSYIEWPYGAEQGICNQPRKFRTQTIALAGCQFYEQLPGLR
jgi:hypothetical protein